MYQRHVVHLSINSSVREAYAFLADPLNYPKWSAVVEGTMARVGPLVWSAMTEFGERLIQFSEPNPYGVLDHAIYEAGAEPVMMPLRVVANGAGCELIFMFFRRPGTTDEQFASAIEWVTMDFLVLKGLLEI